MRLPWTPAGYTADLVSDGSYLIDGGSMFGTVPKVLWSRHKTADEQNRFPLAMNCLLLRGHGRTILIETGMGNKLSEKEHGIFRPGRRPLLMDSLRLAECARGDVDLVLLTHLHFDHSGWVTQGAAAELTFPNARLVVQRAEYEAAAAPDPRSLPSYPPVNWEAARRSGRLELREGPGEVAPGIRAEVTPGHTLAHQVFLVGGGEDCLAFLSDLFIFPALLRANWVAAVDLYPLLTMRTKAEYLERARREGWRLFFYHEDRAPLGVLTEDGYEAIAL